MNSVTLTYHDGLKKESKIIQGLSIEEKMLVLVSCETLVWYEKSVEFKDNPPKITV